MTQSSPLHSAFLILIVLLSFNFLIFIHELGHFLAAKWRGLEVDRFQIWFGKPIWKKTIGGVQYGIGWIPAGGYVSIPQMAPMEAIEGETRARSAPLPAAKPLDKIIVAFAGPLFSFLLAVAAALAVSFLGKPTEIIKSTTLGYIQPNSPAQHAGFLVGDQILKINGQPVEGFRGNLHCITERIVLSKGDTIQFEVARNGEILHLQSTFSIDQTPWYQRRGLRRVGFAPAAKGVRVLGVLPNSPAAKAGLQEDDVLLSCNGEAVKSATTFTQKLKSFGETPFQLQISRDKQPLTVTLAAKLPDRPANFHPVVGLQTYDDIPIESTITHPSVSTQIHEVWENVTVTLSTLFSRSSSIGLDQMSGPIGILKLKFQLLELDHAITRWLSFMVMINLNLAIFNLLPLPVLDGGHITLSLIESLIRRPIKQAIVTTLQSACALALIAMMLYVTSKDLADPFKKSSTKEPAQEVHFNP